MLCNHIGERVSIFWLHENLNGKSAGALPCGWTNLDCNYNSSPHLSVTSFKLVYHDHVLLEVLCFEQEWINPNILPFKVFEWCPIAGPTWHGPETQTLPDRSLKNARWGSKTLSQIQMVSNTQN